MGQPSSWLGSHIPVLHKTLYLTDGPALELGTGCASSHLMHWLCSINRRPLVSYESSKKFYDFAKSFEADFHEINLIGMDDWDKIDIERPWDVVLVDQNPVPCRAPCIARLAPYVKYLVLHDSNARYNYHHHYDTIWHLFKWKWDYTAAHPNTTIVSNLVDLTNFII